MVDVTKYFSGNSQGGGRYKDQTILLFPQVDPLIPDFELLPRTLTTAAEFLGFGGLDISIAESASSADSELIKRFNEEYQLHAGGMSKTVQQAKAGGDRKPDSAVVASICKPEVLSFLTHHPGWFIESEEGFLAFSKPGKNFSDIERTEALNIAVEFMQRLSQAGRSPSIPNIEVVNNLNPKRVWAMLTGFFCGFFGGVFTGGILMLFINGKFAFAIPVFAILGAVLGILIGKLVGNRMS